MELAERRHDRTSVSPTFRSLAAYSPNAPPGCTRTPISSGHCRCDEQMLWRAPQRRAVALDANRQMLARIGTKLVGAVPRAPRAQAQNGVRDRRLRGVWRRRLSGHVHGIFSQMHLKYSNGSRQVSQRYDALQAVEPNSLTSAVSTESQRGQAIG